LEKSRSGYAFLEKMSSLKPEDLDGWNSLIEDWAIDAARKVLDELKWRLELIERIRIDCVRHEPQSYPVVEQARSI
jgi:hypothetical protein